MEKKNTRITDNERERYARQLILPDWGEKAQLRLKQSTVFIAGAGGLGSPVAMYLAAAGVGCIRICDYGDLELSNLNRQILYTDQDIGYSKVQRSRKRLFEVNPNIDIVELSEKIGRDNIESLAGDSQIIIDCLDNFATRYILNEFSVRTGRPFIHAGVQGMSGQMTFIDSPETPCLRCIFPETPPQNVIPVIGATAGVIGSLEALEALKYLTGRIEDCTRNRLVVWDGATCRFESIQLIKNMTCPVCGKT